MAKGTCEFCGDGGVEINKEHVWPSWLGTAIMADANAPQMRLERGGKTKMLEVGERVELQTRCACKDKCNGGWMSQLETKVKPFFEPMAVQGALTLLDQNRRSARAAWAIKTAMVYEFLNSNVVKFFTSEERRHVMTYVEPPAHIQIWIGDFLGPSRTHGTPVYKTPAGSALAANAYAVTFTAKRFLMQVLAVRDAQYRIEGGAPTMDGWGENTILKIWPNQGGANIMSWPPSTPITDDNLDAFENRFWPPVPLIHRPQPGPL